MTSLYIVHRDTPPFPFSITDVIFQYFREKNQSHLHQPSWLFGLVIAVIYFTIKRPAFPFLDIAWSEYWISKIIFREFAVAHWGMHDEASHSQYIGSSVMIMHQLYGPCRVSRRMRCLRGQDQRSIYLWKQNSMSVRTLDQTSLQGVLLVNRWIF